MYVKNWYIIFSNFSAATQLYSFGYRLPADSYAIFRINKQPQSSATNEVVREKRNFFVKNNEHNPHRTRNTTTYFACTENRNLLDGTFPLCTNLTHCDSFGHCLVQNYPDTRTLSTSKKHKPWMTSEVIEFESDAACTEFIREFFVKCRTFIDSCSALKGDVSQAYPMLGCLFREYPEIMLPLFKQK